MSKKKNFKLLSFMLSLALLFSNFVGMGNVTSLRAEGMGTWENPYSVVEAILKQDKSVATVEGYIIGQPTADKTVKTTGFNADTAIAIAESSTETDTAKMLYIQLPTTPADIRANFGLKTNPNKVGVKIKATGSLEQYFTPHSGLKSVTKVEEVSETVDKSPVITHTPVISASLLEDLTITAGVTDDHGVSEVKLYYQSIAQTTTPQAIEMVLDNNNYTATIVKEDLPSEGLMYYIEATDGINIVTSPENKETPYEVTITTGEIIKVPITGLSIDSVKQLQVGQSEKLAVRYTPEDTTEKIVEWTTNDPAIASVAQDGTVTAVAPGTAKVTVTSKANSTIKAECIVTAPQPALSTIAEARAKAINDFVQVSGVVTFIDGNNYYIQDSTGGIDVFKSGLELTIGDRITVTGPLADYNGLLEIKPASVADVVKESSGNDLPQPKLITIDKINESVESQLVKLENVTLGTINNTANTPITDNSGKTTNIYKLPALTGIVQGDTVNLIAVVSQFTSYQLRVRSASDVEKITVPDTTAPVITHTPVTSGNATIDLTVSAVVTDNKSVSSAKLYYKTKGQTTYKSLDMTLANETYTAVIPKADLSVEGLEYYIEATDGTNSVTSPADKAIPYEVAISAADIAGPTITKLEPADNAVLTGDNIKYGVRVEFSDVSGIDTHSVKLSVDGIDVLTSATVKEDSVSYAMNQSTSNGKHTATVEVSDTLGNKTTKNWSFTFGQQEYNFYFGQLHSHTNLSDGTGTPDQAFTYARDEAKVDYVAITDHSNWFDNDVTGVSLASAEGSTEWKQIKEKAEQYTENGKFVGIGAFEMTWSGSTGGWGHINTFNTPGFLSRNNKDITLQKYYEEIAKQPQSISQLNHPGKTFGDFADFGFYSAAVDQVVNLIEVGNGEGPIRGSGYFPSYEYYTRALDKGWHVAPSNNQDNHKGKWGNANTAKTVMIAPELTREALYDAMRNKRVYSTEDENLQIMYKVNNQVMGSSIGNPSALNVSIQITDPDAADKIGKVSIIANGGTVVTSKSFSGNTANWEFTLDPQYNYYYVRVDQEDKDIAVTAPVWIGEATPLGISKVEVSQNPQIVNKPVNVTATLFNNTGESKTDVKVEFFKDSISSGNKIGEFIVPLLETLKEASATIAWTATEAKEYKIYAQATIAVDGKDKIFSSSAAITVGRPEDLVKVVIDGGHVNQYVSGDYSGKMTALTAMLKEKRYMLVQNNDELTAADLENARILILTDPQSKDTSTLKKSNYTDAEILVIQNFIKNGGNLIITSRADYNDKGVTDPSYQSAAQGNRVLEAIGANLRFNDDEVIDNTSHGGAATENFRLYFNKYISSKYNLTNDMPEGLTYSAYSGCSVVLKNGGNSDAVDWLIKGHDTTEILDSDGQNDAVPVAKGEVYSLAAEVLSNGSKIIVAGTTFFSDFETASVDDAYSNAKITGNILDWMGAAKPAELKTIADVRVDANGDGIPDNMGKKFTVEGIVTSQSEAVVPRNSFFEVIYVQDATGGITVFGVSETPLVVGQKVRVTGTVEQFDGDAELQIFNEGTDVIVIDSSITAVAPKVMSTGDSMKESNEGWLVKVEGVVTKIDGQNIYLNDGSGVARAYVEGYIGDGTGNDAAKGKWDPTIGAGDTVSVVGLASQDPAGHRLRVRNTTEIIKIKDGEVVPPVLKSIRILGGNASINAGSTLELKLEGTMSNDLPATESNLLPVVWTSSDESIAAVSPNGVVTGKADGIAVITAKIGSVEAVTQLIVNAAALTGISADKAEVTVEVGSTAAIKVTAAYADGKTRDVTSMVTYVSSNPEIAKVDDKGVITGVEDGNTNIIVTFGDKKLIIPVTVKIDECFIATAAYGSKFQGSVVVLRQFRDQQLLTNRLGSAFVKFYYKNSPPIANFIAHNAVLKTIVRILLMPFVGLAYLTMHSKLLAAAVAFAVLMLWSKFRKMKLAK